MKKKIIYNVKSGPLNIPRTMLKITTNNFRRIALITYFTPNWTIKGKKLFMNIYYGPGMVLSIFTYFILLGPHNN